MTSYNTNDINVPINTQTRLPMAGRYTFKATNGIQVRPYMLAFFVNLGMLELSNRI